MSEVYLARDSKLSRKVALKIIRPEILKDRDSIERFLLEARATAQLNHPNIVTVYDTREAAGHPYLALEFIDGPTLRERMNEGPISSEEVARFGISIASALAAAHEAGVLHCDLKPENILVGKDGRLRVCDFGLARVLQPRVRDADDPVSPTASEAQHPQQPAEDARGTITGSPAYMAPEQWAQRETVGVTDVWALGVVLYELLYGRRPFQAPDLFELALKVQERDPAPAPDPVGAPDLHPLVLQCLTKDPAGRPIAAVVVEKLQDLLNPGVDAAQASFSTLTPTPMEPVSDPPDGHSRTDSTSPVPARALTFWAELTRRHVLRAATAYIMVAWFLLQLTETLASVFELPPWSVRLVFVLSIIGFIPTLVFSWAFVFTPDGVRREANREQTASHRQHTSRRLTAITLMGLALAILVSAANRFPFIDKGRPAPNRERLPPTVAVLPFTATGSQDVANLAVGLHLDLLTRLNQLETFDVISHTSVMRYAGEKRNAREIGRELGAAYILEGGVQKMGTRIRFSASLIDAAGDKSVRTERYDRELTVQNLFDIQTDLARAIARELEHTLSMAEMDLLGRLPTHDLQAYQAYLVGMTVSQTEEPGSGQGETAVLAFEEAVDRDPKFALAWARLSEAYSRRAAANDDLRSRRAARAALETARRLEPGLLEVNLARITYLLQGQSRYRDALKAIETLDKRGLSNVEVLSRKAQLYRRFGRFGDAYRTWLRAERLEPRRPELASDLIATAILNDDCKAAALHARSALQFAPLALDVRAGAAEYELECTGDAKRASDLLKGQNLVGRFHRWAARTAALHQRDLPRALELAKVSLGELRDPTGALETSRAPLEVSSDLIGQLDALDDRFFEVGVLRLLGQEEKASQLFTLATKQLRALERNRKLAATAQFASTKATFASLERNAPDTVRWIEETRNRFRRTDPDERWAESLRHVPYARDMTRAGLHDEALDELRTMFENPGGRGFRFVDASPWFEDLKQNRKYAHLREAFGEVR